VALVFLYRSRKQAIFGVKYIFIPQFLKIRFNSYPENRHDLSRYFSNIVTNTKEA